MNSEDYKSVDTVKQALGSIARLGRAAAVHLALACQRASGSTISSDLKNNIQMSCLLGGFDDGASTLMFEKDISNQAKPQIKGRGFIGSGNEIIETQTYFTQPHLDWVFDTDAALTFKNPEFLKQCKEKNVNIDELNKGWVRQYPLDHVPEDLASDEDNEDDEEEEIEDIEKTTSDTPKKETDGDDDWDDWEDDDDEEEEKPVSESKEPEPSKSEISMDELSDLFGDEPKDEPPSLDFINRMVDASNSPNRDKVEAALNSVDSPTKPKIKLNFDPTKTAPNKIKLNIKQQKPNE